MQGIEFRKWAESSYKSYGKDPWFFIRELAQNSRDASANYILVTADCNREGNEVLVFKDNGLGMDYEHAVRYLFRLYSSSKAEDKYSAGMYGAGFWTILRFNPKKIIIESRTKKQKWAVTLDPKLTVQENPCKLLESGTRITLIRDAQFENKTEFSETVNDALLRYCLYLRKNNRDADKLPVIFQGKDITKPMEVQGPVSISFKNGQVEGSIGLGKHPKVTLYARGLPVWEGSILEELSHTYSPALKNYEIGYGLSPVFLLNGNNLDVNISRRCVIDNRELKRVRETAKNRLSKLIQVYTDSAFPRGFFQKVTDTFKRFGNYLSSSFWKALIVFLVFILP